MAETGRNITESKTYITRSQCGLCKLKGGAMQQELVYSELRQTWNLFVDNEWYFEGSYEQCEEMMFTNACGDEENDYE